MQQLLKEDQLTDLKETFFFLMQNDFLADPDTEEALERFMAKVEPYIECSADIYLLQLVRPEYRQALEFRLKKGENIAQGIAYLEGLVKITQEAGIGFTPVLLPDA